MITITVDEYNDISQAYYDRTVNSLEPHRLACSCGARGCFRKHGYYRRKIKLSRGTDSLRILRLMCSRCGRTHAILLSSMVPYSQIPLTVAREICLDYEEGKTPEESCRDYYSVDGDNVRSVIRNWRHIWRQRLAWLGIRLSSINELIRLCILDFSMQFMQIRPGVNLLFNGST